MASRIRFYVLLALIAVIPFVARGVRAARATIDAYLAESNLPAEECQLSERLAPLEELHRPLSTPQPGDWLHSQHEPGQTFAQYVQADPVRPDAERDTIYILPIGAFSSAERELVDLSAEFMALYFNCPVQLLDTVDATVIPEFAQRHNPLSDTDQFLTPWLLDDFLAPMLPDDAVALIGFTATDLWPGDDWNFVFGQASLRDRVGVWSTARFGDPDAGPEEFRTCLLRTLRTATHETGHMFSIQHCTAFECNMCGSNSLEEADRYPLALCPECVAKVCWASGVDPIDRYRTLAEFCDRLGLAAEYEHYRLAIHRLAPSAED